MMEGLASACRGRNTAKRRRGNVQREREFERARDRIRDDLVQLFPTAQTECTEPGQEHEWLVEGESYLALGAGAELFCRRWLGDVRGLYDTLSDFSHPSVLVLSEQTKGVELDDHPEILYLVAPAVLEWQAKLACLILDLSAHLAAGYFGLSIEDLEAWADGCSVQFPHWFNSDLESPRHVAGEVPAFLGDTRKAVVRDLPTCPSGAAKLSRRGAGR